MHYMLYRKYRPLTFNDVIGQEHITKTLKNQVSSKQFAHAYLFTGTRGTGKTTCAKILARAVNCQNPNEGEPCNKCDICKGLLEGTLFDVEEIDAASNNGVDNIRQLRDEIIYTPVAAKYKVYIIDEVHMLSTGAFNALLKTLEEPPSHAIFILATTEAHKVPSTILSRCQRYDFLRISKKILCEQFEKILSAENCHMEKESIELIASLADGSSRDGLSILDKVLEYDDPGVIERILGITDKKIIYSVIEAISKNETDKIFSIIADIYNSSTDLSIFCKDLLVCFKELIIIKSTTNYAALIEKSEESLEILNKLSILFSAGELLNALDLLQNTSIALTRSIDKRSDVEICLLRLSNPVLDNSLSALQVRVERLEKALKNTPQKQVIPETPVRQTTEKSNSPEKNTVPDTDKKTQEIEEIKQPEKKPAATQASPQTPAKNMNTDKNFRILELWGDIAFAVKRIDRFLGLTMENGSKAIYNNHDIIIICEDKKDYDEIRSPKNLEIINKTLIDNRKVGYNVTVENCKLEKYITGVSAYDSIEQNKMFNFLN